MLSRRGWLWWPLAGAASIGSARAAQGRSSKSLRERLRDAVDRMEVVNTHEHIIPEAERTSQPVDFFTLAGHYAINDVISAGLPAETATRAGISPVERFQAFEPYWKHARFTGYGQALRIAIRDIYGFDEISAATLPKIDEAIAAKNKPGLYRQVLKERARIRYSVLDDYWNPAPKPADPEFFVLARKFDRYVMPGSRKGIEELEKLTGVSITSLAGLKQAMEKSFEQSLEAGMTTVKSTIAYNRELRFAEAEEGAAAKAFEDLAQGNAPLPEGFRAAVERPFRTLEDHMFHHLVRLAEAHGVPVQIHTGILAGNGNFVTNTNPTGLTNLFFLYPKVKFDLFHISYPYQGELAAMAKLFPNVHIDFCWAHIISPAVSRRALHEFLETVPVNKIFGYGGDYRYPELSYAHLVMARRNIVQVMSEKVEDGFCSEDEAVAIARMLLDENPARMFPRRRA
ncbi:MAG: amidohydrolase family protein [Bryobacteraceae bacterium]|nr:amidohydrolase family protein [Bryobacteraceae bacterium]